MASIQEKLTFWRLITMSIVVLILACVLWGSDNLEKINYHVNLITVKMRGKQLYENGDNLTAISKQTKNTLTAFVDNTPNIAAAQIINVNFKSNTRYTTFITSNDKILLEEFYKHQQAKTKNALLFSDNEAQNARLVKIINNNFVCEPYKNTRAVILYPKSAKNITSMCSISIPPFLGHFIGYINLHLYQEPTEQEKESLRLTFVTIATSIYEHDVIKNRQK